MVAPSNKTSFLRSCSCGLWLNGSLLLQQQSQMSIWKPLINQKQKKIGGTHSINNSRYDREKEKKTFTHSVKERVFYSHLRKAIYRVPILMQRNDLQEFCTSNSCFDENCLSEFSEFPHCVVMMMFVVDIERKPPLTFTIERPNPEKCQLLGPFLLTNSRQEEQHITNMTKALYYH